MKVIVTKNDETSDTFKTGWFQQTYKHIRIEYVATIKASRLPMKDSSRKALLIIGS